MPTERSIQEFLSDVEKHNVKSFRCKDDVGRLLEASRTPALQQVFADAVFHATFVIKTGEVMNRIGKDAEGYGPLSTQFSEGLERVSSLLRTLLKEEREGVKRDLAERFLSMDQESLARLMDLLADLALIKHWQVDGHALPFGADVRKSRKPPQNDGSNAGRLTNIVRTARLALLLLVVMCLIDPPYTIVGWLMILVIAALLFVIQNEGRTARPEAS